MKRLLFIMFMIMAVSGVHAQDKLNIKNLFDGRYHDNPDVTETLIQGKQLKEYNLDLYRSLTVVNDSDIASEIEHYLLKDAKSAVEREVSYRDGGLYYGFYELPGRGAALHRYIFYLNQFRTKGDKIILIYMEGIATNDRIKQMLK